MITDASASDGANPVSASRAADDIATEVAIEVVQQLLSIF
jgi:hypothetical protein